MITDYLTKGGIPNDWTPQNLDWLAQAHAHHAETRALTDRADWHRRWAAFLKDLLESHHGNGS